jgi:hypothetical protein
VKFQAALILLGKSKINRGDSRETLLSAEAALSALSSTVPFQDADGAAINVDDCGQLPLNVGLSD